MFSVSLPIQLYGPAPVWRPGINRQCYLWCSQLYFQRQGFYLGLELPHSVGLTGQ